jgi:outer membrane protein
MKRFTSIIIALMFSVATTSVFADVTKIGVVDLQKIMQTSQHMKDIQQQLEKEFKTRRDKLVTAEQNLKKDMEKFKRDSAVMSEKKRKALEKQIVAAQQKFEQEGQQYQQELSAKHNKEMEEFYKNIREAIVSVAKNDKYDVVLQKDAAPYSSDKLDITDKVMKKIK